MGSPPSNTGTARVDRPRTYVVVLPGLGAERPLDLRIRAIVVAGAVVVAVDGGVDHALSLGLHVDVAVGGFDSVTEEGLARVEQAGGRILRHPRAKDLTDFELAVEIVLDAGAGRMVV